MDIELLFIFDKINQENLLVKNTQDSKLGSIYSFTKIRIITEIIMLQHCFFVFLAN